ncbi:MAG: FHA domain-containing protein [Pseudomonadota bacterium]
MRRRLCAAALAVTSWWTASPAVAEPAVIATRPVPDTETGDLIFFAGAIHDSGRSLKASSLEMVIDGQRAGPPTATQSLGDWATTSAEGSQTWRPPVSVGLVYLWVQGVPPSVLDGVQGFFRRVPSRTPVYPTIYGRMRQGRARLTAADVSRLGDVAHLEGYRPNLIDALRLDLSDLTGDAAALKLMLVVTDGRDFADPKGDGPGDFASLGREIRKAGVTPLVVAFPPPEADAAQAAANLRDLHESAGGFLRTVDQVQDIENVLESLGQAVADLQRVRLATPASWSFFGGSHRITLRLTASDGQRLTADAGSVAVGAGRLWLIVIALVLALLVVGAVLALTVFRRAPPAAADDDALLTAAHDLIRRGASPQRAVEELTRGFPMLVGSLVDVDPELLSDPRFPFFRTRPGRLRMQEIRDILARKSRDRPLLGPALAGVLAEAVQARVPADKAAETLAARVSADELTAFAGLDLEQLAEALQASSGTHSSLGTPRARGVAVSVQDALRSGGAARGILVGWLVRAGGPGTRGETLRIGDKGAVMGRAPDCLIRVTGDPTVAAEHAEFSIDQGQFAVAPKEGVVSVEGKKVEWRHMLTDGETIAIGEGLFVFKSASAGNLTRAASEPPAATTAPRRRRGA